MKVIHIFNELKFSGAEIMYVDAASVFQKNGCELAALSTSVNLGDYAPFFEKAGYKVLHRPFPPLRKFRARIKYYYDFVKFLRKENYNVVHIHRSDAMWGMALCSWLAKKTSIYTYHNVFSSGKYSYFYHVLLRWTAKNIFKCRFQTISDSVYNNELEKYKNKTNKVYNWFGANRFYPALKGEKNKIREKLNIPDDSLVIVSIGGCSLIKQHTEIIKALAEIIKLYPDCRYLHLGTGCTEKEEKALAIELGVADNIHFCGNQTDVREFLIASDIYLMTSQFEGISLTTIEALACGIPAILYDVPGLRDFNMHGENTILIPGDFQTLAKSIICLYNQPEKSLVLSSNGKAFVNEYFSLNKNASQIFQLYKL